MLKDVKSPDDLLRSFPEYEDIFSNPSPMNEKHFLPLVSVNAGAIYDDLDTWLHFVSPLEPLFDGGGLGELTHKFHDFYNQDSQIAFRVAKGKYTFSGNMNYFAYESGDIFRQFPGREKEIHEDYQRRRAAYDSARKKLRKKKSSYRPGMDLSDPETIRKIWPFVVQLGGEPTSSNWGSDVPTNQTGIPFRLIAEIYGYQYCNGLAILIQLYYDPAERIALLRYDWF